MGLFSVGGNQHDSCVRNCMIGRYVTDVVVCHDEYEVGSLLPCFVVPLCHPTEIFAEGGLPSVSCGGVVH